MKKMKHPSSLCWLFLVLGLFFVTNVNAEAEKGYYNAGLQASKQGDYSRALDYFKKAQQAGLDTATLKYNIAVSYYKLQQYENARPLFMALTNVATFEQLAYFNLGLIANKQKDERAAIRWFQRAYRDVSSKKIQVLAVEALKRLGVSPSRPRSFNPSWTGFVSSSLTHDSNVALVNNDLVGVTNESDTAVDISASAGRWLKGNISDGVRMSFGANLEKYSRLSQNNYSQMSARVMRYDHLGDWKIRIGGSWDEVYFSGSEYQRIVSADIQGRRPLSEQNQLLLRYKLSRIQATDALYDYLDGWRHQLRAGLQQRFGNDRVRYYYELEFNDRKDRIGIVDPFTSYSPMRHSLRVTGWWSLANKWRSRLDARYRYSRYNDENIFFGGVTQRREDNQARLSAQISRQFSRNWKVNGQYIYTSNDSNVTRKSYNRSVVKAGVAWSF